MKKLIILFILLLPISAFGVAYTSNIGGAPGCLVNPGNWDVANCWAPAAIPGVGDSVTIQAGDTIRLRDNRAIGTGGAVGLYDVDILGTLNIIDDNGGPTSVTFTSDTSIRIQNGGELKISGIASPIDPFDCDEYAIISMVTAANKYYILVEDGGEFNTFGCVGFPADGANSLIRARIQSCAPNCNAGAGIVITLDIDVDWAMVTNPATGVLNRPEAIIGSGGNITAPGGFNAELVEITAVGGAGAEDEITATLANNHQVGDIVVNPTRNILIKSSVAGTHAFITSTGGEYDLNWMRVDEMGDGNNNVTAAIGFNDVAKSVGTIEYTAITNCEDGAAVACLYTSSNDFDSLDYNIIYDFDQGYGIRVEGAYSSIKTITNLNSIKGDAGGGYNIYRSAGGVPIILAAPWVSDGDWGAFGAFSNISNGVIHNIDGAGFYIGTSYNTYYDRIISTYDSNEIRNADYGIRYAMPASIVITNNDIDNMDLTCIYLNTAVGSQDIYLSGNTYDGCNLGNTASWGALYVSPVAASIYAQDEDFCSTTACNRAYISWNTEALGDTYINRLRATCNECIFGTLNNAHWANPIWYSGGTWEDRAGIGPDSFFSIHNEDAVANDHWTFGPGGMEIERETVTVVDNTLRLKVTPFSADRYHRISLGKISVNNGTTLTVNLQTRKDETQPVGNRPRLVLKGCGFDPTTDVDEMSDAINTWETVTVTGAANAKGVVHVYLEVMGKLVAPPIDPYGPADPPTLEIYADGINYTRS